MISSKPLCLESLRRRTTSSVSRSSQGLFKTTWPIQAHGKGCISYIQGCWETWSMSLQGDSLSFFLKLWRLEEIHDFCRKASVAPIFRKGRNGHPGNYRPVSCTFVPGKIVKQAILEDILGTWRRWLGTGNVDLLNSLCPTDLIIFYDEMTGVVINVRAVDVIYLYFSKAFKTASCIIVISKLGCFGLDSGQVDVWKAGQWLGWLMGWTPPWSLFQVEYCRICTKTCPV